MDIYKKVKDQKIDESIFRQCWEIAVIDGKSTKNLPVTDFELDDASGNRTVFIHKELPLKVVLRWTTLNDWAVNCNIGFDCDETIRVFSLTFKTPEAVFPEDAGRDDYLMYPFKTGIKIMTPAEKLFKEFVRKDTRYGPAEKTRHLNVIQHGLPPETDAEIETNEVAVNEILNDFSQKITSDRAEWGRTQSYSYPGGISMTWMDYCGPNGGIYFAAHDKGLEKAQLFFAAERGKKGIVMGIDKVLNRQLTSWDCDFVIGEHSGDWHKGAELYREYMDSVVPAVTETPEYFKAAPGFITHYDFKWEEGTITHRYNDIPMIYSEAVGHGFNTILLGGWNNGGFDNYTLKYANDPDLGSETELKDAIEKVHDVGGKIMFYVNALSISMDNDSYTGTGKDYAIEQINGETDCFGEFFLQHPMATLCNSVEAWRENIKRNIKYVLLELNADGIYLDQIGSAPRECYTENHIHDKPWSENYRILLREIRQELKELGKEDYVLLTEYPMDLYKDLIDCFLCYSFWQSANELCHPAMFRYVFPEVQLVDMVLQKPWLGRLQELENEQALEIFCRQFVNGVKYWTYCHAPNNEVLNEILDSVIELRKYGEEYFSEGKYLDDLNVQEKSAGILVKEYSIEEGKCLFAVWNPTGKDAHFSLKDMPKGKITKRCIEEPEQVISLSQELKIGKSLLTLVFAEE